MSKSNRYNYDVELPDVAGESPPWLIRNGLGLCLCAIMVLLSGLGLIKHRESVVFPVNIEFKGQHVFAFETDSRVSTSVKERILSGQKVWVTVDSFPKARANSFEGKIMAINNLPESNLYLKIALPFKNEEPALFTRGPGKITVIISERSVLQNMVRMFRLSR